MFSSIDRRQPVSKELRETAGRTLSKATCLKVQGFAGNCNEILKSNYRRPCRTTIACKSQIMGTLRNVFTKLRHTLKRSENDEMFDLTTNVFIWALFMSATMKSATHRGREYQQNLIACRSTNFEVENSFEILNFSTMMYDFSPWMIMTRCVMAKQSDGRKQRYMSTQIQSCVWERYIIPQKRMKSWNARSVYPNNPKSMQKCLELMENQWSSSGIFPRIHID